MTRRMPAHLRRLLTGAALVGALAATAGTASAQYYGYADAYGYADDYEYEAPRYDRYREYVPQQPAQVAPRTAARIAAQSGLVQIDRTLRTEASYIIDGRTAQGGRNRLIIDRYSGAVVDSIVLAAPRRETPRTAPRVARVDPREVERKEVDRKTARPVPQPPERPAELKPPLEASAPATQLPPPVTPAPADAPAPATASAPPASQPAAPAPAVEPTKPRPVNPEDVRGIDQANDRLPPLAAAQKPAVPAPASPPASASEPLTFPPFKVDDVAPKPDAASPAAD